MNIELDTLLREISKGKLPDSSDLLPFLTLSRNDERSAVNAHIAFACIKAGTPDHLAVARDCIQRAWLLSEFDERIVPLFEHVHALLDDIDAIKEAYKRIGINKAEQGMFQEALSYFDRWQNAYGTFKHLDKFTYDFDILACMERLAACHRPNPYPIEPLVHRKIRLAYLMRGILDVNSALVRIDEGLAQFHNKDRFEVVYFVAENTSQVYGSPQGLATIRKLEKTGCRLVTAPDEDDLLKKFVQLNALVESYRPDVFISCAAIADFGNCFLTMLSNAPVNIALLSGPPPQFVIPTQDWSIAWIKHPMIDSPVNCTQFSAYPAELPIRSDISPWQRKDLDIPESAVIIISAGRTQKFQDGAFWRSISQILYKNPSAYFVVVGVTPEYIDCYADAYSHDLHPRTRFIAWHADYLRLLAMSDIMIDTYPSGGGGTIFDAMALAIPVVSFRNDYRHIFDQTDWSVAEEVIGIDELIASRGDMAQLESIVTQLVNDTDFRAHMGARCFEKVRTNRLNCEQLAKKLEQLYTDCLHIKLGISEPSVPAVTLEQLPIEWLRYENFKAWQQAYEKGYNAGMGDHRKYFYNDYLEAVGLYSEVEKAETVVEFGPGNGDFIDAFVKNYPQKQFWLVDISEVNIASLSKRFGNFRNAHIILNDGNHASLKEVDVAFSFLLCQQMPRSLWKEHLKEVYSILSAGGSYIFQFAFHPQSGQANDSIADSISGSQKYKPDEIFEMLRLSKFNGAELTPEIDLKSFNTEIKWFICKAIK